MATVTSPSVQDVPSIIGRGFATVRGALWVRILYAAVVLSVAGSARLYAQSFVDDGQILVPMIIDFLGMSLATVLALPWFRIVLSTERGTEEAGTTLAWGAMAIGSAYLWGGIFLGLRYLLGIPSIFVLIWYGFLGFAVADGATSGLKALGTSVRIGQGRRGVVGLLAAVLLIFNLFGAFPLAAGVNPATGLATVAVLAITTNISMGAGAHLYDRLLESESK